MDELKSLVTLLKASRSVEKQIEKNITPLNLSLSEFMALEVLFSKGEDMPIQLIAKKVLLSSGSMTYVIDTLVRKKLVERIHCITDKRVIYARLTEAGKTQIRSAFEIHTRLIKGLFGILSEEETKEYIRLNKKIGLHAQQGLD
jgi:MarR family transcriptional regulator, 2-MHQ and catechol-resistance regulon repressor